ncbi:MAG: GspH/FimT family protein [Phycisphaerae bacterium]|nr:GspH/FimT family protein [Phycisphaerae bacterium]
MPESIFLGPPRPHAGRAAGFSFVELVLVLAIVVVVGTMAAPRYGRSLARYRATAAARRVAADLGLARSEAMADSSIKTVIFTLPDRYATGNVAALDTPATDYEVVLSDAPYQATLHSVNFEGANSVSFNGYGYPNRGGTVVVRVGAFQKTVTLSADTGKAVVD